MIRILRNPLMPLPRVLGPAAPGQALEDARMVVDLCDACAAELPAARPLVRSLTLGAVTPPGLRSFLAGGGGGGLAGGESASSNDPDDLADEWADGVARQLGAGGTPAALEVYRRAFRRPPGRGS